MSTGGNIASAVETFYQSPTGSSDIFDFAGYLLNANSDLSYVIPTDTQINSVKEIITNTLNSVAITWKNLTGLISSDIPAFINYLDPIDSANAAQVKQYTQAQQEQNRSIAEEDLKIHMFKLCLQKFGHGTDG